MEINSYIQYTTEINGYCDERRSEAVGRSEEEVVPLCYVRMIY